VTYMNQVIKRFAPLTPCQCAVLAMLTDQWASADEIWKRGPAYAVRGSGGRGWVRRVAYGTITAALRSLVQQGFAQACGESRRFYRRSVA